MYESVYKPTTLWPTISKNQMRADNPVNSVKNRSSFILPQDFGPKSWILIPKYDVCSGTATMVSLLLPMKVTHLFALHIKSTCSLACGLL